MTTDLHIIEKGPDYWNKWRKMNPNHRPNLVGCDLSDRNLSQFNLENSLLDKAILDYSDISNCNFYRVSARETSFRFTKAYGVRVVSSNFNGSNFYKSALKESKFNKVELCESSFQEADLSFSNISSCRLFSANLDSSILSGANFHKVNFIRSKGNKSIASVLSKAEANSSPFSLVFDFVVTASFVRCNFDKSNWDGSSLIAKFKKSSFRSASFQNCKLRNSIFDKCDLSSCDLRYTTAWKSTFSICNLRYSKLCGTSFRGAKLNRTDFRNAELEVNTRFQEAKFVRVRFDSSDLQKSYPDEKIRKQFAPAQIQAMITGSDLIQLKREFTGFRGALHLVALASFLAPYLFFICWFNIDRSITKYISESMETAKISILEEVEKRDFPYEAIQKELNSSEVFNTTYERKSTIVALFYFIHNKSNLALVIFYFLLSYNVARFLLLIKAVRLDHEEKVTGLTSTFYLDKNVRWEVIYGFLNRSTSIYYLIAVTHLLEFWIIPK